MSISISTKELVKKGIEFEIEDLSGNKHVWEYRTPGAGLMLELSRASRKSAELEAKLVKGEASDKDRKEQEQLLELAFDFYGSIFKDQTKDNSEVKQWLRETPMDLISLVVEEVQKQSESKS